MSNTPLYLQLINHEKEQRTDYLDLGQCGLTEIPQELFECNWINLSRVDVGQRHVFALRHTFTFN